MLVALISVIASAFIFRAQVAEALVSRGDDQLRFGDRRSAAVYYQRALHLHPQSVIAADRLAFTMVMEHDRSSVSRGLAVATMGLAYDSTNLTLLADRAFAEMRLGQTHAAALDFARAGKLGHDARYASFAARLALKSGDHVLAKREATQALRDDPTFAPARLLRKRILR